MSTASYQDVYSMGMRLREAVERREPAPPHRDDLREHLESQDEFRGWREFMRTWSLYRPSDRAAQVPLESIQATPHRRWVRYHLFVAKNATLKGEEPEIPDEIAERFGDCDPSKFGDTWDVDDRDPWAVVPRRYSVGEEWQRQVRAGAVPLPGAE